MVTGTPRDEHLRMENMSNINKSIMQKAARRFNDQRNKLPRSVTIDNRRLSAVPIEQYSEGGPIRPGQMLTVLVESFSSANESGAALLEIRFFDKNNERLRVPDWPFYSRRAGEYYYLTPGDLLAPAFDSFTVTVPDGAESYEICGRRWKNAVQTSIIERCMLVIDGDFRETLMPSGLPISYSGKLLSVTHQIAPHTHTVEIRVDHRMGEEPGTYPLRIEFLDSEYSPVMASADCPQHPEFGPIFLLDSSDDEEKRTKTLITVPEEAEYLRISGVDWGQRTATIIGPVKIEDRTIESCDLNQFFDKIPNDAELLVIDTTAPPLGHETLALRPSNLAYAYEKLGIWVVFIPFGSLQGFDSNVSERIFQVARDDYDYLMSSLLSIAEPSRLTYICSSFPSLQAVASAALLKTKGWKILYEVRDDMEEFNRVGYSKWYSPQLERKMLSLADRTVSVSPSLDAKLASMYYGFQNHSVVPNAVNRDTIIQGIELRTIEVMRLRSKYKKVGYVGHLTKSWFDWPLVLRAAKALPDVTFEIVGHGLPEEMELPSNIIYLGPKSHDQLPDIVRTWSAGLIPFIEMPLTRSVDPNKVYEYFAWGLRCISAQMGLVNEYPSTMVYDNVDGFIEAIRAFVDSPMDADELENLETFLATCSWDDRAVKMKQIIDSISNEVAPE